MENLRDSHDRIRHGEYGKPRRVKYLLSWNEKKSMEKNREISKCLSCRSFSTGMENRGFEQAKLGFLHPPTIKHVDMPPAIVRVAVAPEKNFKLRP